MGATLPPPDVPSGALWRTGSTARTEMSVGPVGHLAAMRQPAVITRVAGEAEQGMPAAVRPRMERRERIATDSYGLLLGHLEAGSMLGQYRIETRLPSRGHGVMYAATHVLLQREVTLRILPATTSELGAELARAAQLLATLGHAGIPEVVSRGYLADGRSWLATERVEGATLANVISEWPLTAEEALAMIGGVADILAHVHGHGLVHNHLRPSTIVMPDIAMRFPITLTEWMHAEIAHATSPLPMGTLSRGRPYIAPERLRGDALTPAVDVYALGVIAYQAVIGELPMSPRAAAPEHIPAGVMQLIEQMLAPEPTARPTAAAVRAASERLAATIDDVLELPPATRTITSERFSQVAGEIRVAESSALGRIKLARVATPTQPIKRI